MKLKIGVAGFAHFHGFQLLDELMISEHADVVAIASIDRVFYESVTSRYNIPVQDLERIIGSPDIDVIVTAAVNKNKPDIIIRSLENGKPIITDKPMATTLNDFDAIEKTLSAYREALLLMELTERFSPAMYTAKGLIESGEIGRVVHMISCKPHKFNPPSRPSWFFNHDAYGGLINDLAVHDVDIFRWFANSNVKKILAANVSNHKYSQFENFEDNAEVLLEMENDSIGFIFVNWLTPDAFPFHGDYRVLVTGTKGQIEVSAADPDAPRVTLCTDRCKPMEVAVRSRETNITEHFLSCIMNRSVRPVCGGDDALLATKTALEAQVWAERRKKQ